MRSLARRSGVPAGVLEHPRAAVTIGQVAELTQELWLLTGDELFGSGPPIPLGSFQLVMRSTIHATDLGGALQRLMEASRVIVGIPTITVVPTEDLVRVEVDVSELDDPEHLAAEMTIAAVHRTLGWLTGSRLPLRSLELPWPAVDYAADYEPVFGRHPRFSGPRLAFCLDRALLSLPVVRDEQDLADYLSDQPRVWFARRDYGSTVADQVRTILEQGLRGNWPAADVVSARLNVSTQHLRRLLRHEESSITQIKEDILRDAAIASLTRGEESMEALAGRLGFSEASAFRRAFRRWTGRPPGSFRDDTDERPAVSD